MWGRKGFEVCFELVSNIREKHSVDAEQQKHGGCKFMNLAGLNMKDFHDKQIIAIELMSLPKRGGLTYKEIAENCGVDEKTLWRWRQDPKFVEAVTKRAIMRLHEDLPEVFQANLKEAKKGHVRSVDLLYKLLGLLTDKSEVEIKDTAKDNDEVRNKIEEMKKLLGK